MEGTRMNEQQTTNYYVCNHCGKPCGVKSILDWRGVWTTVSRCHTAEVRIAKAEWTPAEWMTGP